MREFVREELPVVVAAGERLGSLVARSSVLFAVLAGIGAGRVGGDALAALAGVVDDVMRPEAWPLPFQVREVTAPAVGLIVARHAGGPRAALGFVAYAALVVLLRWLAHAISCGRIEREGLMRIVHCDLSILHRLDGIAPLLMGLAVGLLVARAVAGASRAGSNALFEAAGAYTAVPAVLALGAQAFVYAPPQPPPALVAYAVATTVLAGLLAGVVCGRRSSAPVRTAVVLAAILLVIWLYPVGWSQLAIAAQVDRLERPELLLSALPVLGAAVAVATAALARPRTYDPAR